MSDQATVDLSPAEAVLAAQMRLIDVAVRTSRREGWCGEFEGVMGQLFPDGPPDGSTEFVDSDGFSCRGYDRQGFTADGYDRNGRDRDGFNREGYDQNGFNRDGFDYQGRDREGYDADGYDRQGFTREGVHRQGYTRDSDEYRARFRYDRRGYDRDGYDRNGRDPYGVSREERADPSRYVWEWDDGGGLYNIDGVSADGYNRSGQYVGRPSN